jgi:urocanate hydratase
MLMISNNLDPEVGPSIPMNLLPIGGNGAVFQNWGTVQAYNEVSFRDEPTIRPLLFIPAIRFGLFPSHPMPTEGSCHKRNGDPKLLIKRTLMKDSMRSESLIRQMTAVHICTFGPQGIVHGTNTITILKPPRKIGKQRVTVRI